MTECPVNQMPEKTPEEEVPGQHNYFALVRSISTPVLTSSNADDK
jgi:hypothetical protein